jgi:hypothetical protein
MRLLHAVIAGLALGAGIGWWALGHPGYQSAAQRSARAEAARAAAEPKVYRWRDANGVLQITDQPPKGRKYEEVPLREDVNVIPMSPAAPEPPAK